MSQSTFSRPAQSICNAHVLSKSPLKDMSLSGEYRVFVCMMLLLISQCSKWTFASSNSPFFCAKWLLSDWEKKVAGLRFIQRSTPGLSEVSFQLYIHHRSTQSFFNTVWLILNDITIGYAFGKFLCENHEVLATMLEEFVEVTSIHCYKSLLWISLQDILIFWPQRALCWLDSWPAGLKLNTELSSFYSGTFVNLVNVWGGQCQMAKFFVPHSFSISSSCLLSFPFYLGSQSFFSTSLNKKFKSSYHPLSSLLRRPPAHHISLSLKYDLCVWTSLLFWCPHRFVRSQRFFLSITWARSFRRYGRNDHVHCTFLRHVRVFYSAYICVLRHSRSSFWEGAMGLGEFVALVPRWVSWLFFCFHFLVTSTSCAECTHLRQTLQCTKESYWFLGIWHWSTFVRHNPVHPTGILIPHSVGLLRFICPSKC